MLAVSGRVVEDVSVAGLYPGSATRSFASRCFLGGPSRAKSLAVVPVDGAIVRRHWVADPARGLLFADQDHLGPPEPWPVTETADGPRFTVSHPEAGIVPLAGRVLVLGGSWDRNYYHWLLNWLPRLGVARLLAPHLLDDPEVRIMVDRGHARPPFGDFLSFAGIDPARLVPVDPETVYRVEQAISASFSKDYVGEVLRAMAADIRRGVPAADASLPRRIWIDRQGNEAAKRRVANHDAIAPVLAAHGVTPVRLETLPLARQIALFAGAELVAGVNGAGLANMIFSPPTCRVLVVEKLYTRRYQGDGMFSTLAAICGLDCEVLYGRSARDPSPRVTASVWERHNQDVVIDPHALDRALARGPARGSAIA